MTEATATTTVTTAVREVERLAQDALRMMGLPFPQAERAMHAVTWAEAVYGLGLAFLAERETALRAGAGTRLRLAAETGHAVTIDAGGASLLTAGPPALDLATALARRHGVGSARIVDTFGLMFAGELAAWAAGRGLGCTAACWTPDPDDPFDAAGVFTAAPGEPLRFLARPEPATATATGERSVVLVCRRSSLAAGYGAGENLSRRFDAALAAGMASPRAAFRRVGELALTIRQPSSQRSRNQAG